jgi:uncharacterized membrane protein YhaH (DUF805 family)
MAKEGREPSMMWLFFSPSGRIGRLPFLLAWLFWFAVGSIFLAQMMKNGWTTRRSRSRRWL